MQITVGSENLLNVNVEKISNGRLIDKVIDKSKNTVEIKNDTFINEQKILHKVYEISKNPDNYSDEIQKSAANVIIKTVSECVAYTRLKFKACNKSCQFATFCKSKFGNVDLSGEKTLVYTAKPEEYGRLEVFDNRDGKFKSVNHPDDINKSQKEIKMQVTDYDVIGNLIKEERRLLQK